MKDVFKSWLVFSIIWYLIGCFVAASFDITTWVPAGRYLIVVLDILTFGIILAYIQPIYKNKS